MRRPQFSLKTMLWLALVVGAFFGGVRFERARRAADGTFARKEYSTFTQTDDGSWVRYTLYDDGTFERESLPRWAVRRGGESE
jgi:hypothetical protein